MPTDNHNEIIDRIKWLEEHYSTFNEEMGSVKTNLEWLTWAVRWMIAGLGGTLLLVLLNVIITLVLKK